MWVIVDELHAEHVGEFKTRDEAIRSLAEFAKLPWDEAPNLAPCTSWRTCGRNYELIEFDTSSHQNWRVLQREPALNISAEGTEWLIDEPKLA